MIIGQFRLFENSVIILRRYIFLFVIMYFCTPTFAQKHYESRICIGGRAGVSLSRIFFNPGVPQTMLPGAEVGITFRYCEEKNFGIIAELNFRQIGWKETFKDAPRFKYSHTLNYIQLPVFTHLCFGNEKAKFFFNAGPSISIMLGDYINSNFDYSNIETIQEFPLKNRNYNQYKLKNKNIVDYGISAGIGGELQLFKKQSLTLETRFYYGLGNAFHSGRTELFNSTNGMSVAISAGYWFRVK